MAGIVIYFLSVMLQLLSKYLTKVCMASHTEVTMILNGMSSLCTKCKQYVLVYLDDFYWYPPFFDKQVGILRF